MTKKTINILYFLLLLLSGSLATIAQEGNPFQTNFIPEDESLNENYSICQDNEGVMIVANRKGIISFDGSDWKIIKTPELPLVVAKNPANNIIYVGCRNSIGYLSKNNLGGYEYIQIASENVGVVLQIVFVGKHIYFLSQTSITGLNYEKSNELISLKNPEKEAYNFMFEFKGQLYVYQSNKGLQLLHENSTTKTIIPLSISKSFVFSAEYDKQNILLGTSDNKLFLFNGKDFTPFKLQDQQYITDGGLIGGKVVDHDKIALATAESGCLVFDTKTGKTLYTINSQSGLPDDEILAMGIDKNHGIWLAHNYGLTRVDASIPIKNFSTYKGWNGILQAVVVYNNTLYVASNSGIYFLEKKTNNLAYILKENQATSASISRKNVFTEAYTNAEPIADKPAEGFLSRWFSRKQKAAKEQAVLPISGLTERNKLIVDNEKKQEQKISNKTYRIQSVSHVFSKIKGFDYRTKELFEFNGHLIARTQSSIYDLSDTPKEVFKSNSTIHNVYAVNKENSIYVCSETGINKVTLNNNIWAIEQFNAKINEQVYSMAKDVFENYWLGCENSVIKIKFKRDGDIKEKKVFTFKSEYRETVTVKLSDKKPVFFLSNAIYSIFNDSIQPNIWLSQFTGIGARFDFSQQDYTYLYANKQWVRLSSNSAPDTIASNYLNIFDNINLVYTDPNKNMWVINDKEHLYKIDTKSILNYQTNFSAFIKQFYGISGEAFPLYGVTLNKQQNNLKLQISAPYYVKANSNQYQYKLKGEDWNEWNSNPIKDLYFDRTGKFEVIVRARNIFGNISNEETITFTIKPPFYKQWWFYSLYVLAGLSLIFIYIKFRERKLQKENEILEGKIKERTKQIEKQNEELEIQSHKISLQHKEITDSIRYAKRIQTAVMPDKETLDSLLPKHYVLFRPKDIVSGDFFWVKKVNNKIVVAAADCTGHGVPGGFLSMLGVSFLNEIFAINKDYKANEILNQLKVNIKDILFHEGRDIFENKDGMDIALCIIDLEKNKLQFAGANNPLYIIRNKSILDYSADKMPIGVYLGEKESFTNNDIDLQKGDIIVVFSDGFRDQFGGPKQKRMKTSGFKQILLDISDKPIKQQKELLEKHYDNWKGETEQIDDIIVFGIQI
jgi:serine phosphatase RsbU (regulator of sigma subunit)